jgi:hypothetical membrane protein
VGRTHLTTTLQRVGGVAGPVTFVGCWVVGGALTDGYSPVDDFISELAGSGASTRPLMTTGLVVFAAGVSAFARGLPKPARIVGYVNAAATLGIAAFPLHAGIDHLHALAAGTGYASLALMPVLAARARGRSAAIASVAVGLLAGASLLASAMTDTTNGLFQRVGLTIVDAWIVVSALAG